jgi:hypothetical protein
MTAKYVLWALLMVHGHPDWTAPSKALSWSDCRSLQRDAEAVELRIGSDMQLLCLPEGFDPNGGAK